MNFSSSVDDLTNMLYGGGHIDFNDEMDKYYEEMKECFTQMDERAEMEERTEEEKEKETEMRETDKMERAREIKNSHKIDKTKYEQKKRHKIAAKK